MLRNNDAVRAPPLLTQQAMDNVPSMVYMNPVFRLEACAATERAHQVQPDGWYIVYYSSLLLGMTIPFHPFMVELLDCYHLSPCQVIPKTWLYIRSFISFCERGNLPCSMYVFKFFFLIQKQLDWYYFVTRTRPFLSVIPSNDKGWHFEFFHVQYLYNHYAHFAGPRIGPGAAANNNPSNPSADDKATLERFKVTLEGLRHVEDLFEAQGYMRPSIFYCVRFCWDFSS